MPDSIWRYLPCDEGSSARHFALSDALVRLAPQPSVWWHSTNTPTLILGASQRNRSAPAGSVRRQAGGTAVFADRDVLGLDIALPVEHPLVLADVVESYRWLGEVWVSALQQLGIPCELVSVDQARTQVVPSGQIGSLIRAACFGTLSPYEVMAANRKLVGLAQVRRRHGQLLQAGIHLRFDAPALANHLAPESARELTRALRAAAIGLDEAGGQGLKKEHVIRAFNEALQRMHAVVLRPAGWTEAELAHAVRQASETGFVSTA